VFGTAKALAWGVAPVPALMMGVITGCVGGTIRDILAGVPSIIMRPEIYVTAARSLNADPVEDPVTRGEARRGDQFRP